MGHLGEAMLMALLPLLVSGGGCKDARGKLLRKGQKSRDSSYIYQCVEEAPGDFFLRSVGCIYDGVVLPKGEAIADDYYVYECKQSRDGSMGVASTACVDARGKFVAEGGLIRRHGYVFRCEPDRYGSLRQQPYGCISHGNGVARVGTTFNGDGFWYRCGLRGGQPMKELGGCVSESGKRVRDGGWYLSDGFTLTCKCRKGKRESCAARVSGCAEDLPGGKAKRRFLGETWLQGTAPFRYKVTCKTCSLGITIVRTNTQCSYGESGFLNPGCMTRTRGKLLACGVNWANGLQLKERRDTAANRRRLDAEKYRFC